jgi:hypothetical protein
MSRLPEIQSDFQSYLLNGDAAIEAHVVGPERVPIATRLAIYGDGYRARLAEALQANFPVLSELLGEGDFATLAEAYIRAHPSPFFSIRYYGNALCEFLTAEPAYAGAPVLAELASWEWAMTEVFDAPDAEAIAVSDLAQVSPEDWAELRFEWHSSVRRLSLSWNAPQIWKAAGDEADVPEVAYNAPAVEWLLWRQNLRTFYRSLEPGETTALTAAREGHSFGEICALLSEEFGETAAPAKAAGFLRSWVESGLLTAVR